MCGSVGRCDGCVGLWGGVEVVGWVGVCEEWCVWFMLELSRLMHGQVLWVEDACMCMVSRLACYCSGGV